jgi:hypothetical protein
MKGVDSLAIVALGGTGVANFPRSDIDLSSSTRRSRISG